MELLKEDLRWCVRRLPTSVRNLMLERGADVMLAGGFIRSCIANEKINDIDLFTSTKDKAELYARALAGNDNERMISTDNAFTVIGKGKMTIQVIHRWLFSKPADILPSFDFTITKATIWCDADWKSLCDDRFYPDLAAKRLVYCSPIREEEAGGSMLRVLKFYQRGYRIPLDSLGSVVARLIGGVESGVYEDEKEMARIITGLLHEVDPNIDPTHAAHLPETKGEIKQGTGKE